jgi:hypothetical protein
MAVHSMYIEAGVSPTGFRRIFGLIPLKSMRCLPRQQTAARLLPNGAEMIWKE